MALSTSVMDRSLVRGVEHVIDTFNLSFMHSTEFLITKPTQSLRNHFMRPVSHHLMPIFEPTPSSHPTALYSQLLVDSS